MCLPRKIALPSLLSRRLCFWKEGRAKTLPLLIVISITLLNYFFATRAIMPKNWTRQILLTKRHIFDAMLIATNTTLDCPSFVKLKAPGVTACGYLALFTTRPILRSNIFRAATYISFIQDLFSGAGSSDFSQEGSAAFSGFHTLPLPF